MNTNLATSPEGRPLGFWRKKSSWPVIPLGLLALINLYFGFGQIIQLNPSEPLVDASFFSSLIRIAVGIFCALYIYKAVKGSPPIIAQVVGWIFAVFTVIALVFILSGIGSTCPSFFGERVPCVNINFIMMLILYFYAPVTVVSGILAFIGTVALFLKKHTT